VASGDLAAGHGARVLVVEDDDATLSYLVQALERFGYVVQPAASVPAALALLDGPPFVVLLADIGLSGMSGFDLVSEARRRFPDMAIALMTANADVHVAIDALRSEVDDFLPKPIALNVLARQVERLVRIWGERTVGSQERVLAVGAHPDDVEIGVGGILLGHRQAGDQLRVLTMSHGARGGDAAIRAAEAADAASILGAVLTLNDLEDSHISESNPTVSLIETIVAEFDPTIVYTHTLCDVHQDHRSVNRATLVASRNVPNVYCYESPSATVKFEPVRFVSIDPYVDEKLSVLAAYRSQTEQRAYLASDLIRATARYWGRFGGSLFCEPLEVVRDRPKVRAQ
jgi:LmbE family N-acetylglucosaminyl deacetylase/CheY-like chemotaxis protein